MNKNLIGIDLFAGAGGLSLGAEMAGINVVTAIEKDINAARTYKLNHPQTQLIHEDIRKIKYLSFDKGCESFLFGGPPCQGFSTSNQKTRNKQNPQNWLFEEFIRIAQITRPDWIIFENVKGIMETEKGFFVDEVIYRFSKLGYKCTPMVLCAADYGVPQTRSRFFLVGSLHGKVINIPNPTSLYVTVKDALEDLPSLENGAKQNILKYKYKATSDYAKELRKELQMCSGHLVTHNAAYIVKRYEYIPPGGNWKNIPDELMCNYKDKSRCHTGIYYRLSPDKQAVTVGNYRKSMLIHPWENRGLSVREAARLQSFPDSYVFCGSLGYQQQQVGNAVPPFLSKAVFQAIINA